MGVGEVVVQRLRGVLAVQRGVDRPVPEPVEPDRHRVLLLADAARDVGGLLVSDALGDAGEQVVGRQLHVLVGEGVGGELAGRVGLGAGEEHEALAAEGAEQVLDPRRLRPVGFEAAADQRLVLLGLDPVRVVGARQFLVAGELRRRAHLGQRLDLHRVDVREVLDELFGERAGRHGLGPTHFQSAAGGSFSGRPGSGASSGSSSDGGPIG